MHDTSFRRKRYALLTSQAFVMCLQLLPLLLTQSSHIRQAPALGQSSCQKQKGRAQTSASSAHCCRANGIMNRMLTSATSSFTLALAAKSTGPATSVLTGINTAGQRLLITGRRAQAALTALVKLCAPTTPLLTRPHTLPRSGTQLETPSRPMTIQSAATILHTGCVPAATNG